MNYSSVLMGFMPLLAFVVADTLFGLKYAVGALIAVAVFEGALSLFLFQEIDSVTGISIFLAFVLGAISYKKNSPIFVKIQPVILGITISIVLVVSQLMGKPFFWEAMNKYKDFFPEHQQKLLSYAWYKHYIVGLNFNAAIATFLHALLVAYTAFKSSNWIWLFTRGIGLYIFFGLAIFITNKQHF